MLTVICSDAHGSHKQIFLIFF